MLQELPERTKASGVDRWSSWNLGASKLELESIVTVCCSNTERWFISKGGPFCEIFHQLKFEFRISAVASKVVGALDADCSTVCATIDSECASKEVALT